MTDTAETIARSAWAQHCAVADEGRPAWGDIADECAWGPELTEVIDDTIVGDSWSGREWPTGTAQGFLADYHAHPRATHLVLVSTGVGVYADGHKTTLRTLVVVGAEGEAFGLIAPLEDPGAQPTVLPAVSGDLYELMVQALQPPTGTLETELAQLTGEYD